MQILIVAATVFEITPFLDVLRKPNELPTELNIDVLITGIGLTAATYSLTRQIQLKRPDIIIQAGIAGCFDKKTPLGTLFAVKQDCIADQAVMEKDTLKTMFDLNLIPPSQFPYTNGWLVNKNEILKKIKLKKIKAISTNEITTSEQKIKLYTKAFNPVIESMEGAALHYVCLKEKIPFLQIRSVSNYIAERNKKNWKLKLSIINLNKELIGLLQKL